MTYKELYDKALWDLEHDNMTLGEFDRITEPLNKEIPKEEQTDGDLISRDYEIQQIQKAKESNYNFNYNTLIDFIKVLPSAEKTVNKININERVKVKLTDYGKEIFYHQYDNFNKTYGKEIIKPYYPTVDSEGYTSFQLWRFMNLYGKYFDMGIYTDMQNVIEPLEIVFESEEKTAEKRNNE